MNLDRCLESAAAAVRAAVPLIIAASTACAGALPRPAATPRRNPDAFLVLPGFGYGHAAERTFQSLRAMLAEEGIDLYVGTI